jgi:uncharacterized protein (DUF58 family)
MERLRRAVMRENRIYIIPTGRGLLFLAMVVVLILTAATYNNNLIFILAFFLFSMFIVSMLQTHYNLRAVRLEFARAEEGFEGDGIGLHFYLLQRRPGQKQAIWLRSRSKQFKTLSNAPENLNPSEMSKAIKIDVLAWKRGAYTLPEVVIETFFPLGIFRAWKIFRLHGEIVVYPKPKGLTSLLPRPYDTGDAEMGLHAGPDGDFGELKPYRAGESYHQIAWKHYARTGDLYTKLHWGSEDKHYLIPWRAQGKNFESGLSQMSAWVQQAVEENASFEMETPDQVIEAGRGFDHARLCWRALARVRFGA